MTNSNLDADIAHRLKAKGKPEEAQKRSRIEEIAVLVAQIVDRESRVDALCDELKDIAESKDEIGRDAWASHCHLKAESDSLSARKMALEDAVSWETPTTAREAFLMMLLCGWRNANAGKEETAVVDRLIYQITLFLEGISGTTAEELGLESFISRSDEDLLEEADGLLKRAASEPYAEAA